MLSNFFRINMPYGIMRSPEGTWFAFNREYKPLGFNTTDHVQYADYPIMVNYSGLTEKKLLSVAWDPEWGVSRDESGNIWMVHFYNDATNPSDGHDKIKWENYFNKLKALANIKPKSRW